MAGSGDPSTTTVPQPPDAGKAPAKRHWSLDTTVDPTKYLGLLRLPRKLESTNYVAWMTTMESTLQMSRLHEYCLGVVKKPTDEDGAVNWECTNALVRSILTTNMDDEIVSQIGHHAIASEIWIEARRLFSGQTITDWTMTITALVTTRYVEGEDLLAHVAKMKALRRDLILMDRNIEDDMFACYLRISMPPTWNYVFAGLPAKYTSAEVERRIKDEYGIRNSQESAAAAYHATTKSNKTRKGKDKVAKPGEPFCTNCKVAGHWIAGCWSKGGGAEGQGPKQKKSKAKKDQDKKEKYKREKPRANQAVSDSSSRRSSVSDGYPHSSYMATSRTSSRIGFILDSGTTSHICNVRSAFKTFEPKPGTIGGIQANVPPLEVLGHGNIDILCWVNGHDDRTVTLLNVKYCPSARDNLISESKMDKRGMEIRRKNGKVTIKKLNGEIAIEGTLRHGLYELKCKLAPPSMREASVAFLATPSSLNIDIWHRRLGHLGEQDIRHLARHKMVTGLQLDPNDKLGPCDGCAKGKHPQAPFPKSGTRAKAVLDRLHMDLQGPFDVSIAGYRHVLAVVDDHSRKGWKEYLKKKSDAPEAIENLVTQLETLTERKVKIVRSDRGGEFIGKESVDWLKSKGITHETSAPDTHQQNGVAERFNRTTHEHALALLYDAGMNRSFWVEAHEYASDVRNRSPTAALKRITPDEVFFGRKPDVSDLRIFGSKCHVRIPPEKRTKLDAHSIDGIFCGLERNSKAYKIWIPSKRRFMSSRDVIVYEKVKPVNDLDEPSIIPARSEGVTSESAPSINPDRLEKENQTDSHQPEPITSTAPSIPQPQPRRTTRVSRPTWIQSASNKQMQEKLTKKAHAKAIREARTKRQTPCQPKAASPAAAPDPEEVAPTTSQSEVAELAYLAAYGPDTPLSFYEATKSREADLWWQAMREEIEMLKERGTWIVEELPQGRKAIGCRWTYTLKYGPDGEISRYKARLVAQGFSQIPGIDYDDTFSPTVRLDSIRILLHLSAAYGWFRGQDDVKGAFLHSDLDHIIYMRQPEGFNDGTGRPVRLLRSLYGLKQASREWNSYMKSELMSINFHQINSDNAVFVRRSKTGDAILAIHVDNFMSFANSLTELEHVRDQLHKLFEMKREDPNWLMGFLLLDDPRNGTISISHAQYIGTILKRFDMEECNAQRTPMDAKLTLSKADGPTMAEEVEEMKEYPYRELVGALIWIAHISRPDIVFAAGYLAQFNANPGKAHWTAAKRVLRYLAGTRDSSLVLGNNTSDPTVLVGFSDSDWARDVDDRRSISGYVFQLGGSTVSWASKKQPTVAASSTEGEYMALSYASKQAMWIRRFLTEIGLDQEGISMPFHVDNAGAIELSKEARHHSRTKHIDVHHHFIRERVADNTFSISHVPSSGQLADICTKPLVPDIFFSFLPPLGLASA
jgi:hypothetical protein